MGGLKEAERRRLLFQESKGYLPEWRETMLLLAGVLHQQSVERVDGLMEEMLEELGADAPLRERARCVGLMGAILEDLRVVQYRVNDSRYQENLQRALAVFELAAAKEVEFEIRLAAAEAIGQAGDPRLDKENWVHVEGGAFRMGAHKDLDPEAYEDEAPAREVHLSSFLLARYPITVAEFFGFVEAGGYRNERHWRAGGYGQFSEPGSWRDQLRHPNRPVVEVSWYEAAAYCDWAGCRLSTDAEWEFAARNGAEGTKYPWGNDKPDPGKANYGERGPGRPTPVGLYPAGATGVGIQDLAGNVWEWVADWYGPYPAETSTSPHGPGSGDCKVVRGGSWYGLPWGLRSSGRIGYPPEVRSDDVGLRCARDV